MPDSAPDLLDPLTPSAQAALRGDPKAVEGFILQAGPAVLRVVRQILGTHHPDVEDVAQDALMSALHALPRFRWECSVRHFVWRVAALTAMNARRRVMLRERLTPALADLEAVPADGPSPYGQAVSSRRRQAFLQLLDDLPTAQGEAMLLHAVLGYTVAETAAATGVPLNTVRSRLITAKAALRQHWEDHPELVELADSAEGVL